MFLNVYRIEDIRIISEPVNQIRNGSFVCGSLKRRQLECRIAIIRGWKRWGTRKWGGRNQNTIQQSVLKFHSIGRHPWKTRVHLTVFPGEREKRTDSVDMDFIRFLKLNLYLGVLIDLYRINKPWKNWISVCVFRIPLASIIFFSVISKLSKLSNF